MIRIAAVGDLHFGDDSAGTWAPHLEHLSERADVLLLAGDLTRVGHVDEARVLAEEMRDVRVPIVAVLGNHDHHSGMQDDVVKVLEDGGVVVLEGDATTVRAHGQTLGIAGTKGFGGGFPGTSAMAFGEKEFKAFVEHGDELARTLEQSLNALDTDYRVALLHYAPVADTVEGERPEIHPFLGGYQLAEAVDAAGADLVVHGHAHHGREKGGTPAGTHVRNVALPVLRKSYAVYCVGEPTHEQLREQERG